jgi:hypothetical protein
MKLGQRTHYICEHCDNFREVTWCHVICEHIFKNHSDEYKDSGTREVLFLDKSKMDKFELTLDWIARKLDTL